MRLARSTCVVLALVLTTTLAHATFYPQKTLYQRLGGRAAITAVVDDFVGNVARDKRINGFFANTDIRRLKRLQSTYAARRRSLDGDGGQQEAAGGKDA